MSIPNSELRNCKQCGNLFLYNGNGNKRICPACLAKETDSYEIVKNYIMDNPGATVKEVFLHTNVSPAKIKTFIREGRLIIPDSSPIFINCELCDAKIKFGRVCHNCANTLNEEQKKALNINEFTIGETPNPSTKKGMHFLDSNK